MVALPVPARWHWLKSKNPQIRSGGFFRVFFAFFSRFFGIFCAVFAAAPASG